MDIFILVVEDTALIAMELETALHEGGYSTGTEASGEAAITTLATRPDIRALITGSKPAAGVNQHYLSNLF